MAENPFEIPQSLRDMSEQNLKQARAAYEQLMDVMTKAVGAWTGALPSNPMAAVFKEIAKENAESVFTFAGKISNVRPPQDILTLQTEFAQDRMQAFTTQTQQLFSVIEEAIQKSQRGAMDAGMGAMPSIPMVASFKDVQDRAVEIAKKNAESASTPQKFPAPSDNEKPPRRKSAKSKTATSGTSTTPPLPSPTPLTPHRSRRSKPQSGQKRSRGTRRGFT